MRVIFETSFSCGTALKLGCWLLIESSYGSGCSCVAGLFWNEEGIGGHRVGVRYWLIFGGCLARGNRSEGNRTRGMI